MRPVRIPVLVVLLVLALAGCAEDDARHVTRPAARPPIPGTPQGAVQLLAWCWNEMDTTRYRGVFTEDFQFVYALGDSAGNPFRDDPFGREEMLLSARHLFAGGGSASPAASVVFTLDQTLVALDDARPGRDPRWHREVPSGLNLEIQTTDHARYDVTGGVTFFVVRGDSAAIPPGLGLAPDSTRWYVERIEDVTLGVAAALDVASPQPGASTTWGRVLALYLR